MSTSFSRAATIQGRVIRALVLRDMLTDFGLSRLSLAWMLIKPAIGIVAIFAVMVLFRSLRPPAGMSLVVFVITGFLTFQAFSTNFGGLPGVASRTRGLTMFPHVTVLDLMMSKVVVNWFTYLCLFIGFTSLGVLFAKAELPANPLAVLVAYCAVAMLGMCVGMLLAVFERFTTALDLVWRLVRRMMIFVCGVMHPGSTLPTWAIPYFSWNPVFHCLELMREAWWPAYQSPFADGEYVAKCLFFLLALALVLERGTRKWIDA
jgi:capsular polysaccharide transport system permease protein